MATLTHQLIERHLVSGTLTPGREIGIRVDQTLTQDATGTLVMLELEALGLDRVRTEVSAQYVDHNLLQQDHKNPDDHILLRSACERFGIWFSPPGNGVSHPVHQQRFGRPGATLLGSDSHTPAAGALGMLAIGAGGIDVAMAMAGLPYFLDMPRVHGVELVGELPDWVSAKDLILEMLRRHGVAWGRGKIVEYFGPGLSGLSVMDRHVVANMGTELGATSTVFPADAVVREFLERQGRPNDFEALSASEGAVFDSRETVDLSTLEPLVALPSSPGNVVPVREVAGRPIYQAYIGSSANPGYRDFAIVAEIMRGASVHEHVSLDLNPASRQVLTELAADGRLAELLRAGARLHQVGCNGCIGMGQAPPTEGISLRTVPRNFPGRSGTAQDQVYLVSPETAAASALTGVITDPRTLGPRPEPSILLPQRPPLNAQAFLAPLPPARAAEVELRKGPHVAPLPELGGFPETLRMLVALEVGDNVSTDEILPAGARVLPHRSNIPRISEFCFEPIDPSYASRVRSVRDRGSSHCIVAGSNYGQGSSREHAALAPRSLGLRVVLAESFARIHERNLVAFGVLPLTLPGARHPHLRVGKTLVLRDASRQLRSARRVRLELLGHPDPVEAEHALSTRQIEVVLAGGYLNWLPQNVAGVVAATPEGRIQ